MFDLYSHRLLLSNKKYTFTINPTPSDAIVTINGVEQKSIVVNHGTEIIWNVSKNGYISQSGTEIITKTKTQNVVLELIKYTFTINPTPSNATVTINGSTRKTITAVSGTKISWSVSASGYTSQSGTLTLTANTTKNVKLVKAEPLYYCYHLAENIIFNGFYYVTQDLSAVYVAEPGITFRQVSSSKELTTQVGAKNITKDSIQVNCGVVGVAYYTAPRYAAGDLYS